LCIDDLIAPLILGHLHRIVCERQDVVHLTASGIDDSIGTVGDSSNQ
jgi:hypothetical protein